jgi:hypothetical protein
VLKPQVNSFLKKYNWKLSMVIHACNHSYLEGGDQEDHGQDQPRQKVSEALSQSISWAWWFIAIIQATREA